VNGRRSRNASAQRQELKAIGGIRSRAARPTTMFVDQKNAAQVSSK
jgi:hypothetical protein